MHYFMFFKLCNNMQKYSKKKSMRYSMFYSMFFQLCNKTNMQKYAFLSIVKECIPLYIFR
jgi:hypothetical protein